MMIADNLGLTVRQEDAYKKWALRIGKTADALTDAEKKQAFLNAMLEAGEIKVAEMGGATVDAAAKLEQLSAAALDVKSGFAEMLIEFLDANISVEKFATNLRAVPETLKKVVILAQGLDDVVRAFFRGDDAAEAFEHGVRMAYYASADFLKTFEDGEPVIDGWAVAMGMAGTQAGATATQLNMTQQAMGNLLIAQEKGIETGFQLDEIADRYTATLGGQREASENLVSAMAALSGPAFADQTNAIMGMEGTYESWVEANEAVLESYKNLIYQGMYGVQIAAGEFTEDIGAAAVALGIMGEKEAAMLVESSRVSGLLGEALMLFDEQLSSLSPEQLNEFIELIAGGEAVSLRGAFAMVTNDMWQEVIPSVEELAKKADARLPVVTKKFRDVGNEIVDYLEPAIQSLDEPMVTFGVVTEQTMKHAKNVAGHAYDRIKDIDRALYDISSQPHTIDIQITTTGSVPNYQHGTPYHPGGLAMVGEAGPELVMLPRGSRVYGNGMGRNVTQRTVNYNRPQTVYVQDTAAVGVLLDQKRKGQMQQVGSNL
jgi:hypothetical protein